MASTQKEIEQINTHSFPHIEQYEQRIDSGIRKIKDYIFKEPAIVLTILYLSISTIGLAYLAFVLLGFNINVLPHVELTDFVLSAIHYPMTLAVFLAFFIFAVIVFKLEALARKRWLFYRRQLDKYHKKNNRQNPTFYFSLVVIIYLFVSANVQSLFTINALKAGEQAHFSVQLNSPIIFNNKTLPTIDKVQVIANLSKHIWLYQKASKQVFMIAHENVKLLSPLPLTTEISMVPKKLNEEAKK